MLTDFYRKWFSDTGYLGIHLVIGFIVAFAGAVLFLEIAEEVLEPEEVRIFDAFLQDVARKVHSEELTRIMVYVTFWGEIYTFAVMSFIVGLLLHLRGSHRRLYTFAAIMGGGGLLNHLLKLFFARNRPEMAALIEVHGYSFPSGHAMGAALFFGGLGYVLFFTVKRKFLPRLIGIIACAVGALLIGVSRIYLGVHYASDVLAGFIGGVTWVAICIFSTEVWIRWRPRVRRSDNEIKRE